MKIKWTFSNEDIALVHDVIAQQEGSAILQDRRARNLGGIKQRITRARFWRALSMGLLTTQQPSGPDRPVSRFLDTKPFPLALERMTGMPDPAAFVTSTLMNFGGIRRHGVIGQQLANNLPKVDGQAWATLVSQLERLHGSADRAEEREVSDYLAKSFVGLGPKQARNLLQSLGLTRYEIPIDSRIAKWLNRHGFPVPVTATALADRDYYCFVLDGIQLLCEAAGVTPCELDGAIFASFDRGQWQPESVVI